MTQAAMIPRGPSLPSGAACAKVGPMIQLSCAILGRAPADVPPPPPPLRLSEHPDGLRVTGVWEGQDLAAARHLLGGWLETAGGGPDGSGFADGLEAVDLFTGQAVTPAQLLAQPTVGNVFHARHVILEGQVWARLFGCYALGESDVVAAASPEVPIEAVYRLLTHYAAFRLADNGIVGPDGALPDGNRAGGERRRDRPIPYGYWFLGLADSDVADADFWTMLRDGLHSQHLRRAFDERMATPSPLLLLEAEAVAGEIPGWRLGVTRAAALEDLQLRAARRWGVRGSVAVPSGHDAAGACSRVVDGAPGDRFAYREEPSGAETGLDSGWRIACDDPNHVHDRASFRILPLHQAVALAPELLPYLGLPPGSVVLREADAVGPDGTRSAGGVWVQPPGHDRAWQEEAPEPTERPA